MTFKFEALQDKEVILRFECEPGFSFLALATMLEKNRDVKQFTVFEGNRPFKADGPLAYLCKKYVPAKKWDKVVRGIK